MEQFEYTLLGNWFYIRFHDGRTGTVNIMLSSLFDIDYITICIYLKLKNRCYTNLLRSVYFQNEGSGVVYARGRY